MKPTDWGWILKDAMLYPVLTDLPPAPVDILKVIKCSCMGECDKMRCSCHKNGMLCTTSRKNCKGISCQNFENGTTYHSDYEDNVCNTRGNALLFPFYYFSCSLKDKWI